MSKKKPETRPCPECEGTMTFRVKTEDIEYKGRHTTIDTEAWWCTSCDEGILSGPALQANEHAYLQLKAEVEGLLSAEAVQTVRKKLRLSQRKAGEMLGGGPRAFQKYESGSVVVSAPMSKLLTLLGNDPSRLKELELPPAVEAATPPAVPRSSPSVVSKASVVEPRGVRRKKPPVARGDDRSSEHP